MDIYTIKSGSAELGKSETWVRHAIRLNKLQAEMIGSRWVISGDEIRRVKRNPFQISNREMCS